jgi:hypothetical protein
MEKDQHWQLASRLLHVVLAYTQLRLARRTIDDVHLPWEIPQRPDRRVLTPGCVRQAVPQLLVTLGTPANAPKPCGRSPGRPKGARSGRAPRFPALKKPPDFVTPLSPSQNWPSIRWLGRCSWLKGKLRTGKVLPPDSTQIAVWATEFGLGHRPPESPHA